MKKKISIFVNDLDTGGAERVISIILNMLYKRYDITLFMMHNIIFYDIPKEIKVVIVGNSNLSDNGLIKLLKLPLLALKYRKLNKSSISISFLSRANYINILAKIFGMKSKVIISERAMPSLHYKHGLYGKINRFLMKLLYPKADLVFANSKGNALDLEKNFGIKEVKVVNNLFDIAKIQKLSKEGNITLKKGFNFITVGRLDNGKNHKLLINAIKDINANLYIIGDGILREELAQLIKDLKLSDRVFLLGKKKNPYKYLSKADVFLFSSNREGFPNVLIEALACNLPVISTDCQSGPREILAPNTDILFQVYNRIELAEFGILTPINRVDKMLEAMKIILNNKKLRKSYKEKSLKRAMEFDKDKIIDDFINLF